MSMREQDISQSCRLCQAVHHFQQSEACRHLRNARREMLLAAKAMIETCLDKLDEKEIQPTQAQKVEID